jgi:DegV family protein with EDD domain
MTIHIVTDSSAVFVSAQFTQQHPVTIVPNKITLGDRVYREGIDISAEDALKLIGATSGVVNITPPTVADYVEVYGRLAATHDAIISIHASREIFLNWQNARTAAQQMMGHCEIVVIDTQTLCAAQGMLVQVAAMASETGASLDDVVRLVRGAIDRVYAIYYVETVDFLARNEIMSASHAVLGTMLGIKPFVALEDGHLIPIEKVKTRGQAVERLVEFAVEFTEIEDAVILQPRSCGIDPLRALQERLALEFPGQYFPHKVYSPSLGALIGADATGMVILERENEDMEIIDDDF